MRARRPRNILTQKVLMGKEIKKAPPSKNPIWSCFFRAKSKQDADAEVGFQQTHCGTALVNKHWDEEDHWHCSPFNTAPEEEENSRYSVQPLSLLHENTIHNSSPWNADCMLRCILCIHFSSLPITLLCRTEGRELQRKQKPPLSVAHVVFHGPVPCNYTLSDRQLAVLISS